ncbi:transcriptional regulator [Mycolicibacterium madagascariense]|uniref:transcriptional regulator n=1 Tax=Mycolicibacterium madagascariense TaxID=212765 RepID=UPI0013D19AAB|nr:transcriptional regulator [Mycolicibacterium madagascariense]MCV7011004.1 transcriptional regulator [Mycolicibacterium madagascariense]
MTRSPHADPNAVEELADAVATVGLDFVRPDEAGDVPADGVLVLPDDRQLLVEIETSSLVTTKGLRDQLRLWSHRRRANTIGVVVADRITADAREELRAAGWSWLDTRGHLRLAADGLLIDANVPAALHAPRRREPFAGRVGIEVASAMLLTPERAVSIRPLAAQIGRAPSSVSATIAAFRDANLVTPAGLPRTPELFWELASRWRPTELAIALEPRDGGLLTALRVNFDDFDEPGWALGDSRAAAVYGAPIAIKSNHPPVLYVPDQQVMRRAAQLLVPAREDSTPTAVVRVAPTPLVCTHRQDPSSFPGNGNGEHWPMTRPLFVALDLVQDPGRGREIVDGWTPPEPWSRVW